MDPVGGNLSDKPDDPGGVKAGGSDLSGVRGRPGWVRLLAAGAVVLVVGGFALSRDYGVQSVPSPPGPEEIATPTTSGTTSSTVNTVPVSGTDVGSSESIDSDPPDWTERITDLAVSDDGALLALSPGGIARLDDTGWTIIDIEGLPQGKGLEWVPGRLLNHIAAGPNGVLWVAGEALSGEDDEQYGWNPDWRARILRWVARLDCPESCTWTVFSSDGFPELSSGLDDMVISGDGTLFASAGGNVLLEFDGSEWESHDVPTGWSVPDASSPWSESLAVGTNGVVWAAVREKGLFAFDGEGFTQYTTDHGLPSNNVFQVAAGGDGTIWAAADTSYIRPAPEGVASFDGVTWTIHTTEDGLLSSDAYIATGAGGTVWAIHPYTWPQGYSRFDGTTWTSYPFGQLPVGGYRAEVGPDGTLWTISDEGLTSFDGITQTIYPSPFVPALPGTITVSIDGWEGVEGYRLLAVVSEEDFELVGGAFWTMIDSDPYMGTDVVHPPNWEDHPPGEYETWGEGAYLWDETARLKPGIYQITFWANPGELAPYGSHIPSLPIERECQVNVEVTAGHNTEVVISDIPITGDGGQCQRATDDTSVRFLTFTPVEWGIILRPGVHTVSMEANIRPLTADLVEGVSGTLIWDETVVDLCAIGTEQEGVGLLHIGDTFQTTEGCGDNPTAMRDAFDDFGLPKRACVLVTVDGLDHEYCAPLQVPEGVSVGSEPGTVTVLFDGLEVFEGLAVDAWVLPLEPTRDKQALGGTRLGVVNGDRYFGSAVMHPQGEGYFDVVADEVAFFSPGTYRFIIEGYVPLGEMYFGCERQIQVVDGEPTVVSVSRLPTYTSSGWHWTPYYDQLEYPDCP